MHSSRDRFSNLYIYSCSALLTRTARVRRISLRVAYTTTRLILADTRCKVVVVRAKLAGAIRAHPGAARTRANLKRHTAIRA
jgi:hypothetical protein